VGSPPLAPAVTDALRLAVVSDSHGTLTALEAVVADLRAQAVDEILLGGDLVQGGRQPAETLDLIAALGWPAVLGNADLAVLEVAAGQPLSAGEAFDEALIRGLRWTADRLSPAQLDRLRALPRQLRRPIEGGDFVLVHATPWSVEDVVLPDAPAEVAERMLAAAGARVLAYGHIHTAYRRSVGAGLLASVGAVAGSNDRDRRPAYTIFTLGREVDVEVRRVEYDGAAEVAALRASDFPLRPARERQLLEGGDWPVRS
jgi:predicted phosphodiesterase